MKNEGLVVHIWNLHTFDNTSFTLKLVYLICDVHYMWFGNQELELQEWEDFIKSKKTIILAIIMLGPNNNPPG